MEIYLTEILNGDIICTTEYEKRGARKGLIEKSGEKPARSRHCNAEQFHDCHWETGKTGCAMRLSQENCLSGSPFDLRAIGRGCL